MFSKYDCIEKTKNSCEEAARKVDFAKRFASKVEECLENNSEDDAHNALYSLKSCLDDASNAAVNSFSKLKSLQETEKTQPEFIEENFAAAASIVCKHCKATENYWLTECERMGDGTLMGECPVARLLDTLEEKNEEVKKKASFTEEEKALINDIIDCFIDFNTDNDGSVEIHGTTLVEISDNLDIQYLYGTDRVSITKFKTEFELAKHCFNFLNEREYFENYWDIENDDGDKEKYRLIQKLFAEGGEEIG